MREKYAQRKFIIRSQSQIDLAKNAISSAPIDPDKPLEVIIREEKKQRKPDQNALMWAGQLRDIAEQAYISGRLYTAEIWHEYFKKEFLPEEFDSELTKDGYRKWDTSPVGDRVLVGSTKDLTIKGFAIYLTQIEAFGANLGVMFTDIRYAKMPGMR